MNRDELLQELAMLEARRADLLAQLIAIALQPEQDDHLLTVEEAAGILRVSVDWLYRHAKRLPFTVRPGPGQVRFSKTGIQDYLKRKH